MGANNKICPNCGKKMKQQFIGLQHCKCGMSWKRMKAFLKEHQTWSLHWKGKRSAKK